ncbi:MAG: hypothetical protein IPN77_16965 [Sandaracinaceae bacterium]|nr:hypothetical protein [Sandaracinaceae bacterium]
MTGTSVACHTQPTRCKVGWAVVAAREERAAAGGEGAERAEVEPGAEGLAQAGENTAHALSAIGQLARGDDALEHGHVEGALLQRFSWTPRSRKCSMRTRSVMACTVFSREAGRLAGSGWDPTFL